MNAWIAWAVAASAASLVALDVARESWRRRRHARRVNRALVPPALPSLYGPLRDAACGALVGAALGDAMGQRVAGRPLWLARRLDTASHLQRAPRALRYGVRTQVMLAAARAIDPGGALNTRRYRLELAYLSRYAAPDAPWSIARLAAKLRRTRIERDVASRRDNGPQILLIAVPIGIALHDRPERAARQAATLARHTHRRDDVTESAALVASAIAHSVQLYGREARMSLSARRHWLDKVTRDAGGPDSPAAIAVMPSADLAAEPLRAVFDRLGHDDDALDSLVLGLQVAMHRTVEASGDPAGAVSDALALGRLAPSVASLALALLGARLGLERLRGALGAHVDRLQDAADIELHGEKLAMVRPVDERPAPRRLPRPEQ